MDNLTFNKIKEMLVNKGKTSKALAVNLNVQEPTVSSWCTNHSQPSIKRLYEIAKFLNVEARDLLNIEGELKKVQKKRRPK